jgi:predicted nucleic acid-binding Zn ribbon protein
MTGDILIPENYNEYFDRHCVICRSPITQPKTGRPRRTCSNACRQKLYRRTNIDQLIQRMDCHDDREAEKQIKAWERVYGPFPDTPDANGAPGLRWRLKYRLVRGIPISRCEWCGRPFVTDRCIASVPACCSPACYQARRKYNRAIEEALRRFSPDEIDGRVFVRLRLGIRVGLCEHCGKPFPDYRNGQKYCSPKCRQAAWRSKRRKCACCGETFVITRGKENVQLYCSKTCYNRAHQERYMAAVFKPKVCQHCGKTFTPARNSHNRQRYCSRQCSNRAYYLRRRSQSKSEAD